MTRATGEVATDGLIPLSELAGSRQHGILLTRQATALGWPARRLTRRLRSEGWTQIHRGAWAEPGLAVDHTVRLRAIQLARPELVVSHRTAAWLHTIELPWESDRARNLEAGLTLDFTTSTTTTTYPGASRSTGRTRRVPPLAAGETGTLAGIRVTTVNRTLADLLRAGPGTRRWSRSILRSPSARSRST
ncbi:type IV toxin-antitoxin system AbiEi family antitoxin domain-containing protein [Streptomyces sp. ISL-98]|uniref:type IV toxin-antitoxin system AbiEi family antitoxin domain-containing protein n=1 Tax=Streptomyces sp. ISL-98 TaxID=2819192 RepID=UPI00203626B8|nr:type IV toxin-antitoxin system AbiEi family antitoxin domain-containing protein [Streptomyces sp. ISL-98]